MPLQMAQFLAFVPPVCTSVWEMSQGSHSVISKCDGTSRSVMKLNQGKGTTLIIVPLFSQLCTIGTVVTLTL